MDDLKLIKNVLNGDLNSFDVIISKYELSIFRFILAMVKDQEDAKDFR